MGKLFKTKKQKNAGITLIALVITIVVLLILAGITINLTIGQDGIITKAQEAGEKMKIAQIQEKIEMHKLEQQINKGAEKSLKDKLIEYGIVNKQELEEKGILNLDENILIISNFEGLKTLSENVENGNTYEGKIIYMLNDIDCKSVFDTETGELISGENFNPIGDSNVGIAVETKEGAINKEFKGTFDGVNYSIKNLYIKDNEEGSLCTGLFGNVGAKGTIKNLSIIDSYIQGYYETGAFVGRNKGEIINCINEAVVIGDSHLTAGIVGRNTNLIDNCINKGRVKGGIVQTAGIVANCDYGDNIIISNCKNFGTISSSGKHVGGIIGGAFASKEKEIVDGSILIINCTNEGKIDNGLESGIDVGGIAGVISTGIKENITMEIKNCINRGEIIGYYNVGGISGRNRQGKIENSINYGKVTTNDHGGAGIAGWLTSGTVSKCANFGYIYMSSEGNYSIGGIVGGATDGDKAGGSKIEKCYNSAEVYNTSSRLCKAGGIVGSTDYSGGSIIEILDCYNTGYIHGMLDVGGIAGIVRGVTLMNCYNIGKVAIEDESVSDLIGGILGTSSGENNIVQNNYWLDSCGATYGNSGNSNEGAERKTSEQLKTIAATLGESYIQENSRLNGGYPYLKENMPVK